MARRTRALLLILASGSLLAARAPAQEIPPSEPSGQQTLRALAECGVPAANVRIAYEDLFQSEVVTISDLGGTGKARMDCVRKAVHASYVVMIEAEDQRRAYYDAGRRQARIPASRRTSVEARLRDIAVACGLPARTLGLTGAGRIRFRPPTDAGYEEVDCAFVRMRQAGLSRQMPMAFVGNETYQTGNPE